MLLGLRLLMKQMSYKSMVLLCESGCLNEKGRGLHETVCVWGIDPPDLGLENEPQCPLSEIYHSVQFFNAHRLIYEWKYDFAALESYSKKTDFDLRFPYDNSNITSSSLLQSCRTLKNINNAKKPFQKLHF